MKALKSQMWIIDRSVRELEHCMNTAAFFPAGCEDAVSILDAVDYWRDVLQNDAVNEETGGPVRVIGSRIIARIINYIEVQGYPNIKNEYPNTDTQALERWHDWHVNGHIEKGPALVDASLQMAVVQKKGARMSRGQPVEGEEPRILVKIRPWPKTQQLWEPALTIFENMAIRNGGYVAGAQAANDSMRRFRNEGRLAGGAGQQ